MKFTLLVGCLALGVVGCATERYDRGYGYRGGVNSPYETEYGTVSDSTTPYWQTEDSIYPVRRQPLPTGIAPADVKPLIDPVRHYDWDGTYYRDYPPRVPVHELPEASSPFHRAK